ncbi:MAG: FUSC family protein [Bacteroidota bacterium]
MKNFILKSLQSQFWIYASRCIIGFLIGYLLSLQFPQYDLFWAMLSIILVISPDEKEARQITIDRVKSNFIGSLSGLMVFFLDTTEVVKTSIGIFVAIVFCKIFNLMSVARTAVVTVVIIIIGHQTTTLIAPIERFISVFVGCMIGLSITLFSSWCIRKLLLVLEK